MKIQTRVALLFTFITGMVIFFLSITVYYFSSRYAFNDFLKRLELRAVVAAKVHFDKWAFRWPALSSGCTAACSIFNRRKEPAPRCG